MNPPEPTQSTPPSPDQGPIHNPLAVMQQGEKTICEIKRHPVGIIGVYVMSGLVLLVILVLVLMAPHFLTSANSSQVTSIGLAIFLLFAILALGFVFISNKVYWGNRWILTSDSITQISQIGLFDKQSSQLSLGNLEDVTVEQNGILPHMFNYGLLRVETAGERSKFQFPYCPNPNECAKQVLNAREQFEQDRRAVDPQPLYRGENSYSQPTPLAGPQSQAYAPPAQPAPYGGEPAPAQYPEQNPPA